MTQITPSDLAIWGRLVKSWITGLNYVQFLDQPPSAEDTLPDELKCPTDGSAIPVQKLTVIANLMTAKYLPAGANFNIKIPPGLINIYLHQRTPADLHIALPQTSEIQQAESDLINGGSYIAADYECDLFGAPLGVPPPNQPKTPDKVLDLTANLIGDYSIQNCR